MTELTGKNEVRERRLSAREKSCNEQPYVRTLLAIATAKERIKRLTSKYVAKQMNIAMTDNIKKPDNSPAARQLDKETRRIRDIGKELMKVLIISKVLQITMVRQIKRTRGRKERSKLIKNIKIIIVKNHAYLLLTTFADPS